jgi:hypothetical protein
MRWSDADIPYGPKDHPDTVAKTLIDSGASLNLMMRKTFIEMGLNLAELTPVHDNFHGIIPG